jgi:hypothetical protein
VAAQAHQNGSTMSASKPSRAKVVQNIFFCIGVVGGWSSWPEYGRNAAGRRVTKLEFAAKPVELRARDRRGRLCPHCSHPTLLGVRLLADFSRLAHIWRSVKN